MVNKVKSLMGSLLLIFLIVITAGTAKGQYKTKSFKVNKNGHLLVDITYGDITIKTWNKNEVFVKYESDDDDDEDENGLSIKEAGNHVRIRSNGSFNNEVEVTVPAQFYVEMKTQAGELKVLGTFLGSISGSTSGGDITIEKINGFVDLVTYGGNISANEIKGEIKILTYGGDIQLTNIDGNGTVTTSGGNIKINNVSKSLVINTAGGNVTVEETSGKTKLSTGGGNIGVRYVSGSTELRTGGGNIKSGGSKGDINASTGSGNIYLYKVNGSVKAVSGSGDIMLELVSDNYDSQAKTSNGKIRLYIPDNAKITVEARVRDLKYYNYDEHDYIKCELSPTGETINKTSDSIKGIYLFNGGGKKIYLDTSYGEIEIKKLK